MARKSQALRLTQAKETLAAYTAAGLETMSQARFLRDMVYRMGRNKYPTKRQRDWLDTIIEEGVPAPKGDQDYIAKIDEAIATEGIDFGNVLIDFRGKLARGWDLSVKQKTWCDNLIEKAAAIRDDTFWRPDAQLTERIKLAISCSICYNQHYWSTHPGGCRALSKAKAWLTELEAGNSSMIDEYTVTKLLKSVSGKLRQMENPKFVPGGLGYVDKFNTDLGTRVATPGLIVGGPTPAASGIVYEILVDGEIFSSVNIRKRR